MSFLHTGGIFAEIGDEDCTHLVVDDQQTPVLPKDIVLPHFIVRAEVLFCLMCVKFDCSCKFCFYLIKCTNLHINMINVKLCLCICSGFGGVYKWKLVQMKGFMNIKK